jgi:uncharacterized protein YfaS (alpha-2-macroglobulin family)
MDRQAMAVPDRNAAAPFPHGPPPRLREYFPETFLWKPALITDEEGKAELPVTMADSITTWRLTASASSRDGTLGGTSASLKVFRDFFVDVDLPLALTCNDEVAMPVTVYNYLKEGQKLHIQLRPEQWFDLAQGNPSSRILDLKPNEVTVVYFRIRAKQVGHFPLTVTAHGTKLSDAVRRTLEVRPDGFPIEQVASGRLAGTLTHPIVIPEKAIPGASRLIVRIAPSILGQLLDGVEGLLQLPHGCFEQTSACVYPNLLVLDYLRKSERGSAEVLRRAENYLNLGYQRLLTFQRPGGGFDWWGNDQPVLWLTALGLHEFSAMAKVGCVDPAVLERTRTYLLAQQAADGSWTDAGTERALLLTSYITWALLQSGVRCDEVQKAVAYIRERDAKASSTYELALAANALAAWDSRDQTLAKLLAQLERHKQNVPGKQSCCFPSLGRSLTYAWGDSLTVETTALAALAFLEAGAFSETTQRSLIFLGQARDAHGTWATSQATILALQALVRAAGNPRRKGTQAFAILVNGKEVQKGEINEANADVLQQFNLTEHLRPGDNRVTIQGPGETAMTYQVVARHFERWKERPTDRSGLNLAVDYDRKELTTRTPLLATATLKNVGKEPTAMVMVELGIPPGFTANPDDFANLVAAKKLQKFSLSSQQAILYLGEVKPGDVQTINYTLRPRHPIKAKTPPAVAYEYYTPTHRATASPVELVVQEAD